MSADTKHNNINKDKIIEARFSIPFISSSELSKLMSSEVDNSQEYRERRQNAKQFYIAHCPTFRDDKK
jgi:hypothetical protein